MTVLFITILNMSITASVVALAVMLVRIPLKKAPKIFSYALWGVVLFRLICPISIASSLSFMPTSSTAIPQNIVSSQNPAIRTGLQFVDAPINAVIGTTITPIIQDNNTSPIYMFLEIAGYVWLIGFAIMTLFAIISYVRLKRRVYYATLIRDNIFETDRINTPFVLGFINPKIYVPIGLDTSQHEYILKHEQTHIKRLDYIIKPFAFIVFALHWFNPFMWVAYILMAKDIEMSCDEAVLRNTDKDIRSAYSSTLYNLSVKRSILLSPLAFGESNAKSRIRNVVHFKKPSTLLIIISCLFMSIFLLGFSLNKVAIGVTDNVEIRYDNSTTFNENEIKSAINTVLLEFEDFKGCDLIRLWYDESASKSQTEIYMSYGHGSSNGVEQENVIVLLSDFYVDSSGGDGSFNPDTTYSNWMWILIRDSKVDKWTVDDWGY